MSQQYPFGNANDKYKKKLFVDMGTEFSEVKARIVEPYGAPTPNFANKEIQIINAPSHFHQMGITSYKVKLRLIFNQKIDYNDYLMWVGWTHKFYDEKGHIYLGTVDSLNPEVVEASTRYVVELELTMIKKNVYDRQHRFQFQDIDGDTFQTDIEEMSDLGLISVMNFDGQPVLYFHSSDYITRAEFISFLNRTRRLLERVIRE